MEKLAQAGGNGGGLHTSTPNLFHYIHHHVQSYRYAPAKQADTLTLFHVYPYVLCGKNLCWAHRKAATSYSISSVLYGKISEGRSVLAAQLLLIAMSLACLVAQWYSYGGSWKWVTILSILIGILHLLSAICFCISSYVHQQLNSLDCQHFVHYISLVLFTFLRTPNGCRVSFLKGTYNFQNCLRWYLSPIQNLKEAMPMTHRMYSIVHLSKIIRLSAFKSPLFYPSS